MKIEPRSEPRSESLVELHAEPHSEPHSILLTTGSHLHRDYEPLGLATGFGRAFKPLHLTMQGQLEDQLTDAQSHLEQQARRLGADAVVDIRMAYSPWGNLALTGTAVRYRS